MSSIRIITCFVLLYQCQFVLAYSFSFIPDEGLAFYDKSKSGSIAKGLPDFRRLSADQDNIQSVRDVLVNIYTLTGHSEGLVPSSTIPDISSPPRFKQAYSSPPANAADSGSGIISDPNPFSPLNFETPYQQAEEFLEVFLPSHKYSLRDWTDINKKRFTELKRSLRKTPDRYDEFSGQELTRMLVYHPPSPPMFVQDDLSEPFAPIISFISDSILEYYLSVIYGNDVHYLVVHNANGTISVKIRYNDGTEKTLSLFDIMTRFGQAVAAHFERIIDLEADSGACYRPYNTDSRSQAVVIPHKKKTEKKKGDPIPDEKPQDGGILSKSASPKTANSLPPSVRRARSFSIAATPFDPGSHPPKLARRTSSQELPTGGPVQKNTAKPPQRFAVAKVITELSASENKTLRDEGIKQLAGAVKRKHIKQLFGHFPGYPQGKPKETKIRWLLDNGRAIDLANLVIRKSNSASVGQISTSKILLKEHLTRVKSIRRTIVQSQDMSPSQSPVPANTLPTLMSDMFPPKGNSDDNQIEAGKIRRMVDEQALEPLLKDGWQLIITHAVDGEEKVPMFHSGDQKRIIAKTGTSDQVFTLTAASNKALDYLLWEESPDEAIRLVKIIGQLAPIKLDDMIKDVMESHSKKKGEIERQLGLSGLIRFPDHPRAGNGHITLAPARKHIKVVLHQPSELPPYVNIEVSIEFPSATIGTANGENKKLNLVLFVKNSYRYELHSLSVQPMTKNREVVVTSPQLPQMPSDSTRKAWEQAFFENTKKVFFERLEKHKTLIEEVKKISPSDPVNSEILAEHARTLQQAMQKLNLRYEEAREWDELPLDEVESLISQVIEQMAFLQQRAEALLNDDEVFTSPVDADVRKLLSGYRKYVSDALAIYRDMHEIYQRRERLTAADLKKINDLVQQAENVGNMTRAAGSELPTLRGRLRELGRIVKEKGEDALTLRLQQLYYPLNTAFTLIKTITLTYPVTGTDQLGGFRERLISMGNDDSDSNDVDTSQTDNNEPEPTLPMTFEDNNDDLGAEDEMEVSIQSIKFGLDSSGSDDEAP